MILTQFGIALFGVAAVYLSQDPRPERAKWACVFGLAGQPFWIAETVESGQWGMVALCVVYAFSWARGFHTHWLKAGTA